MTGDLKQLACVVCEHRKCGFKNPKDMPYGCTTEVAAAQRVLAAGYVKAVPDEQRAEKVADALLTHEFKMQQYDMPRPKLERELRLESARSLLAIANANAGMVELTQEEVEALMTCFEESSQIRYGKVNKEAPLYKKLAGLRKVRG